jgi:hypothetical protein
MLLPVLLAVAGWIVGHWLNARRDLANKRRELRVRYLVDAWRSIEKAANRADRDATRGLEEALADVQLFGTSEQAAAAAATAREMAGTGVASVSKLLEELRADLRRELYLGPASGNLIHLRVTYPPTKELPSTPPRGQLGGPGRD